MDPRNLAKEVHVYGYNFEWQTHIVSYGEWEDNT